MAESVKSDEQNCLNIEYILQNCDQRNHDIPYAFDQIPWKVGQSYKIRIGNIYDPSKFWIVPHEKELMVFHKYLNCIYEERFHDYLMPRDAIKKNRFCVVYTDNAFYRGIIVDIPRFTNPETSVVVFLFDFGFTSVVKLENFNVCYLHEKMYNVPQFSIRACLNGVEPAEFGFWSKEAVKRFSELTLGKTLLCVLDSMDLEMRLVHIRIGEILPSRQFQEVGQVLCEEKLAKLSTVKSSKPKNIRGWLVPKVKYPFLFPSHQAIENCRVPLTHYITEEMKNCPFPATTLFKPYFGERIK